MPVENINEKKKEKMLFYSIDNHCSNECLN